MVAADARVEYGGRSRYADDTLSGIVYGTNLDEGARLGGRVGWLSLRKSLTPLLT
jgi:hypothetical protein